MQGRIQSYYATKFGTTLGPIKARISANKLETYETHSYLPPYSEVTYLPGAQKVKKIANPKLLPSPAWNTRFYIGHNGLIISPNYCAGSFSSEFTSDWKKYSTTEYGTDPASYEFMHITPGKFAPDLLYAIPQDTWDDFIAQLPFQNIVKGLNLSVHRHLWPAYNYSASTEDLKLQHWRTNAFSKYHFLVSLLDPVKEENCFYNGHINWKAAIDQGVIAKGKMIDEAKIRFGAYVTPTYLDKFSHYPALYDFTAIGEGFIEPKAKSIYGEGPIDTAKLNEFIAALPSSKKDPVKFENMISDANVIRSLGFNVLSERINGRILYHARNNFGLFKNKNLSRYSSCHYYCIGIFNDLVYPEILRNFFEISTLEYEKYNTKVTNDIISLYYAAQRTFEIILHEYLSIDKLIQLSDKWHLKRVVIDSNKPEAIIKLQWHPLFSPQTINQVTFTCIETEAELKKEGNEMHNCVGGFASFCLSGETHIIRANTPFGERSVVRLEINLSDKKFMIVENVKSGNKTPCEEILNASDLLLEKINNDNTILNWQRGKTDTSVQELDDISRYYPYPLYDQSSQEAVYQAYTKDVLPSFMLADNYPLMIEKLTGKFDLADCVRNKFPVDGMKLENRS